MKLLLVRHGDPDYSIDSLTEKGWREAEALADRLCRIPVKEFYVSPLGRARDTASLTLSRTGRTAVTLDWLKEFPPRINRPDRPDSSICWDWLPQDWTREDRYYLKQEWDRTDIMQAGHVGEEYRYVTGGLDELLAGLGYERDGRLYRVRHASRDTYVLFCHFGVTCVMLSHLLGVSPMILWHGTCSAPTSVTTLVTEERREGIALFRMTGFGDISHLYAKGEPPAFAARFCECFDNADERHD